MVLFRGQGEGLPLDRWLAEVMWPREARLTADDVEVAMTAASAEMLAQRRDHQRRDVLPPGADRRRRRPHRRARDHRQPAASRCPACRRWRSSWRAAVELAAEAPDDGTVEYGLGPHAAYTVPLPVLREAAAAAREHGLLLHLHVAETATEGAELLAEHGLSVPALLAAHDVLGGRVLAAHCVHMDDGDLELWQEYDVAVAHCPASNAKLASGVAPAARHARPRHPGRAWAPTVRRPTTGSTCSPTCGSPPRWPGSPAGSATALTAAEAVWLATGAAADAVGRPDLGQLAAGRRADLVHVDTRDLVFEPVGRPGRPAGPPGVVRRAAGTCATSGSAAGRWSPTASSRRSTPRRCAPDVAAARPRGSPPAELLQPNG